MTGLLRELEHHRLCAHGPAVLEQSVALIAELISYGVLPGVLADMLTTHSADLRRAILRDEAAS